MKRKATVHWWHRPDLDGRGIAVIGDGRKDQVYLVDAIADAGRVVGYRFRKEDGTAYDLPADGSSCECLGYLRWQTLCRHRLAVLKLKEGNHACGHSEGAGGAGHESPRVPVPAAV